MTEEHPLEEGACFRKRDLLPLFFSDNTAEQNYAKALCFTCPVQLECLEMNIREPFGVFGGTLPSERAKIRKLCQTPAPDSTTTKLSDS